MGNEDWKNASSVYDFTVKDIQGNDVSMEKYKGHVLLITNIASLCGLTATNYKELVELDEKYRESKGLRILAFPCNQFAHQEPGTSEDIVCFAKKQNANFDLFEKVNVNGDDAHPLWKYLKEKQGGLLGKFIKWNFTKFIVDKDGQVVERHGPNVEPHTGVAMGNEDWKNASSVYDFTVKDIQGKEVSMEKYKGHVLLIANIASLCGLTATNYKELVELDEKYRESKGLRILAFPCNQFANEEPGTSEDIVCFAKKQNAHFDLFEKVKVNGDDAHPLWKYLKEKQGGILGNFIKWNFTKFIVDKDGQVVERHGPNVEPHQLAANLEKYF